MSELRVHGGIGAGRPALDFSDAQAVCSSAMTTAGHPKTLLSDLELRAPSFARGPR